MRLLRLLTFGAVLLGLPFSIGAATDLGWRGYSSLDGLRESYCSKLSVGPSGRVFIIHGHTDRMSVLDGYGVRQLPVP